MSYQPNETINPLKDALVKLLVDNKATLGLKTVKKDAVPTELVDQVKKLMINPPGAMVIYLGRQAQTIGMRLETIPTFSILVADYAVSAENDAVSSTTALVDQIMHLIHGKNPLPKIQTNGFEFMGDQLTYQDMTWCMYELRFGTMVNFNTRP